MGVKCIAKLPKVTESHTKCACNRGNFKMHGHCGHTRFDAHVIYKRQIASEACCILGKVHPLHIKHVTQDENIEFRFRIHACWLYCLH